MKLEGIREGRMYASEGRTVFVETDEGRLGPASELPAPLDCKQRALTSPAGKVVLETLVGRYLSTNVWQFSQEFWLATVGPEVFVTHDAGVTWTHSLHLPPSSGIRGLLPGSVCLHDGVLYLGEYPLAADAFPRILRSTTEGLTWEVFLELPDIRHVHSIQVDPFTDDLWVTTGDRDHECQIGRLRDGRLEAVVSGSQRYRATELAFTPDAILWGVDCAYVEENELLRLDRDQLDADDPVAVTVGHVPTSVYHCATLHVDGDTWVVFSTAGEAGTDRTAPDEITYKLNTRPVVVAASSATEYTIWHDLAQFDRQRSVADWPGMSYFLPRATGYVFLAADPERGVVINPFNAVPQEGSMLVYSHDYFRELAIDPEQPVQSSA